MKNSSITFVSPSIEPERAEITAAARVLVKTIELYQRVTAGRISACRFYPSCSNYACEAIATHGAVRGSALSLRRLLRCRPLGPHGVDLVPQSPKARSNQR
jgi:putative membrane protein insertion efficiency factor